MSIALQIQPQGIEQLEGALSRLATPDLHSYLDVMGALVESQTRARLSEEKKSPGGEQWAEWSARYARTRHSGQKLLESRGDLIGDIHYIVEGDAVWIGSALVYAAKHQLGSKDGTTPAREYLGLSAANEAELIEESISFLASQIEAAQQ